ncbi:hypothetical protein P7D31_11575 [Enterococcus dongliensis]|uniref:hypothetical protein n=1 Tax=Enterococcus dongliensis TaxID=2559925 RepID=UPI0028924C7A|nr:hypothetical protein [Enterococcus dongliensis]MDT2640757.1 hypothetical protein [Enterococcus dongliensis]
MFDYVKENPEEFIAVFTVLSTLLLNLLGFGDEEIQKKKLKIILLSYGIVLMLILSTGKKVTFFLLLLNISLFLFGGLLHGTNENQNLEKELGLFHFFIYNSSAWFLLAQNYILLGGTIISFILTPIFHFFNVDLLFTTITLGIISIILLFIQYLLVIKDYFGLESFNEVLKGLCKNKEVALNMGIPKEGVSSLGNDTKELLSFVLYCEDKNFFERKSNTINLVDLKMRCTKRLIFKDKIVIDAESRKKQYIRGYSTIEQQLVRQFSMTPYSYKYTIRRKIFNDWLYTPLFCKSICNRKARTYGKKKKKAAQKELMWNLKYMLLIQYFIIVLKKPKNSNDLIKEMSKQSRVSVPVYEKMYSIFKGSDESNYYIQQINDNASRDFNFY